MFEGKLTIQCQTKDQFNNVVLADGRTKEILKLRLHIASWFLSVLQDLLDMTNKSHTKVCCNKRMAEMQMSNPWYSTGTKTIIW